MTAAECLGFWSDCILNRGVSRLAKWRILYRLTCCTCCTHMVNGPLKATPAHTGPTPTLISGAGSPALQKDPAPRNTFSLLWFVHIRTKSLSVAATTTRGWRPSSKGCWVNSRRLLPCSTPTSRTRQFCSVTLSVSLSRREVAVYLCPGMD